MGRKGGGRGKGGGEVNEMKGSGRRGREGSSAVSSLYNRKRCGLSNSLRLGGDRGEPRTVA